MPPSDFGLFTSLRYDPQLLASDENTALSGNNAPSPFYNFLYHHERFINALDHFGWRFKSHGSTSESDGSHPQAILPVSDIETFRNAASSAVERYFTSQEPGQIDRDTQSLKLRPVLSREGVLDIEVSQTPPVPMTNLFPSNPLPAPSEITPPLLKQGYTVTLDPGSTTPSSHTEYKTTPRPQYDLSRARAGLVNETEPREVLLWNPDEYIMEGSRTNVYLYRAGRWITPSEDTGCLKGTERRWLLAHKMVEVEDVRVNDVRDGEVVLLSNGLRGIWGATVSR